MGFLGKSVLVSLIALWCFTSSAFTEEVNHETETPSSAPAPAPYHHGHHHPHPPHHHHPSPSSAPAPAPYHHGHHHPHPPHHHHPHPHPPAKAPLTPPVSPPTKPPVKPPVYPPAKAPVKPPSKPSVKPPVSPPVNPPAKAPVKPPVKPPVQPPVKPPVHPPKFNRSLIAVQGTVFCRSCQYASSDSLNGAKPVEGAVVKLLCPSKKNEVAETKTDIVAVTKTDKNGYFLLLGPKTVTNYGFRGCRVYLVKSKDDKCNKVSKLFGGDVGAVLKPEKRPGKSAVVINKDIYGIFNVGPFAFDPVCPK